VNLVTGAEIGGEVCENSPRSVYALKQPLKEMTRPDTLLQVLPKAFNTNSRSCQEIFYASKANPYRHLARNKVAFTNKVPRRRQSKRLFFELLTLKRAKPA
jgi:hypothetical protein